MNKILNLFTTFLKIGGFTFGGGYAMIPLIQAEIVEKKKWISEEEMIDMIAIAESTPGVIAVNSATYVGYKVAGFWGSFFATLGVILPSIVVISVIALFYKQFLENKVVQAVFNGIRAGVIVLIFNAFLKLFKGTKKNVFSYLLITISFILSFILKIDTLIIIFIGALAGTIYYAFVKREVKTNDN